MYGMDRQGVMAMGLGLGIASDWGGGWALWEVADD